MPLDVFARGFKVLTIIHDGYSAVLGSFIKLYTIIIYFILMFILIKFHTKTI